MNAGEGQHGEVLLYRAPDGKAVLEVRLAGDTVWLSQKMMGELFDKNVRTISEHVRNVFKEGELDESSVIRNFRITAADGKTYETQFYNLDVGISVGYRVKSKRGTQFRIWANRVLRDHLLRGYTLNEKRLLARGVEFDQAVALLTATLRKNETLTPEGQAILDVVQHYAQTWRTLRAYDEDQLSSAPGQTSAPTATIDIATAREAIRIMRDDMVARGENPGMFGQERGAPWTRF